MTKPTPPPPKARTYFEQIPLEHVIKKIEKEDPPRAALIREPAGKKTEPYSIAGFGGRE